MKKPARLETQSLARAHGIQTSYLDNTGIERFASEETLRVILGKLGVDVESPGKSGIGGGGGASDGIEPVYVCWQEKQPSIRIRLNPQELGKMTIAVRAADGTRYEIDRRRLKLARPPRKSESRIAEFQCFIPELPTGYHSLIISGRAEEPLLISAPRALYHEKASQWGVFVPIYSLHSERSWGAGNLSDWRELCSWLASQGGSVAGTLPILSAFLDQPICEPSPYSPASRLFWNEFFIDITALPEFAASASARKRVNSASFRRKLSGFKESEFISYKDQWELRRHVLEILARDFFKQRSDRWNRFREYKNERPEAEDYARFRAACDQAGAPWQKWNNRARAGRLGKSDYDPVAMDFYHYAQWAAQEQIDGVLDACRRDNIKFYLDLPLGVNPDGYDAWRYKEFFAAGASAGAPPDSFFTKGQDWGFAPLCPRRAREQHYKYVIDYLRFQMRHTGLLRIDHVMGLHRLWWVPHGLPASEGAYVKYRAEELYAILSVESHLHRTTLVGENLGTVPPEVNKSMDRHKMRRMYVLQYEQPESGPVREPERSVVASVNTHDMPTFAAHWEGLDIEDRNQLGLIPDKDVARQKKARHRMRRNLVEFLRDRGFLKKRNPKPREVLAAVLQFLAASPAETVLVNLEDLWCEERPQNVPGTSTERPNWRRKTSLSLEEIKSDPEIGKILRLLSRKYAIKTG